MRLTLRTLLAYLDGILEPNDAQDLGKKIEDSEFATDLVHRLRDVMRRLRLSAPEVTDHNPKLDPNIVAEYLDNTLDAEGVTEFEKVCLESDVSLAEVASCHQILTLVLGEPAEIDPTTRQRMYQVPEPQVGLAPPIVPTTEAGFVTTSVVLPPALDLGPDDGDREEQKPRPRPTVPEYLREPRKSRHWFPVVATLVVAVSLIVVVLNMFGQLEPGTPLGDRLVRWGLIEAPREVATQTEGKARKVATEGRGTSESPPSKLTAVESPKPPAKQAAVEPAAEKETGKGVAGPAKEPAKTPVTELPAGPAKAPGKAPAADTAAKPVTPAKEPPAGTMKEPARLPPVGPVAQPESVAASAAAVKPEPVAVTPHTESDKKAGPKPPAAATGETTPKVPPQPMAPLPPDLTATLPGNVGKAAEPKPTVGPLPPEALGRLMSADQLLLRNEPTSGGWVRVAANQMLLPRRLLALPTYRPQVTLTVGVTLEILGGTALDLLPNSPPDMPGVGIRYGRVVMMPLAKAGSRLRVMFGNRSGVLTFPDAESIAALEVRHIHRPGVNPEAGPLHVVADLYASAGGVTWEEMGDAPGAKPKTLRLTAPQWVSFNAALTSEPATSKDLPAWITMERVGMLDHRASVSLAKELPTDRLARIGLLELNASRPQKEMKWLAQRCLGYVGQYRDMVAVLNDPAHRLDWPEYVDQLREAVARDAESAAAVREALEKQYPQQAALLYRILWGYSDKDLQDGADKTLVNALDNETLAVRVLSFRTLHDLTGLGLFYQPEQTAAKRQQPTSNWRKRLKAGEIRLKTPEEKAGAAAEEKVPPVAPEVEK
jgi:hypothetical protein